ncbi:MAG: 2-phosphosulfolactate phosphatase [Vicingaceae bacterium]
MNSKKVEVSFSPALFSSYYHDHQCNVVVVDIFRATSAICTAFHFGIEELIPVSTLEEAIAYKKEGYMVGAERNGEVVEGFDFGNSPFSYMDEKIKGKRVVLTTTNGTKAITVAKEAHSVLIGSFLNLKSLGNYLKNDGRDVLILCAGWKNRFNLEDSLFAGALVKELQGSAQFSNLADSAIAVSHLYNLAQNDLYAFLENSSHRRRLNRLQLEDDIRFCLQQSIYTVIPVYQNGSLVNSERFVSIEL